MLKISVLLTCSAFSAAAQDNRAARGAILFGERCALCHVNEGDGGQGPNLTGVFGRKAGSAGFAYSDALKASGWRWDAGRLDRYLADPNAAVPGTLMAVAVADDTERGDIVAYLRELRGPASDPAGAPAASVPPDGVTVFGDWHADRPGRLHRIRLADLPPPYETASAGNGPRRAERPANVKPLAPEGFEVELFASKLQGPRILRTAPNGDIFVAETAAGRVRILRASGDGSRVERNEVFASGLRGPFGIAFYPAGPDPEWVYVAENNRIVRFAYASGDMRASGNPETVAAELSPSSGGHTTRDIVFSKDGRKMFVSVGSGSNVAQGLPAKSSEEIRAWEALHGLGAAWGAEEARADVLEFTPAGKDRKIYATGIRNCVGLAVQPQSGDLYCSTNERDGLGDNLVPDYVTRVGEGSFFGWPWRYMGGREDPRWPGARPDLAGKVSTPDVLLQPHSASLGMTFYDGAMFPADYRGTAFAALHGSWNRSGRTGYKVVHVPMSGGRPTGQYQDFLTGFVADDDAVWGRPVGVTVAKDGALLVSEDASGTIWRVAVKAAGNSAGR